MYKFCSCFKGNNNNDKKSNKTKSDVKSNDINYTDFDLFLSGDDESGKTKLIEELCVFSNPFTRKDKILKTSEIEQYIRHSLTNILRGFKSIDPPISLEYPENDQFINYILTTAQQIDFEYPFEFFEYVELLWSDAGLQTFLEKSFNHKFSNSAKYFLNRVSQIKDPDYIPTTEDMIQSRLFPSQTFQMSYENEQDAIRFNLFEMNLFDEKQEELIKSFSNKKNIIIFIVDCSCFNIIINNDKYQTQLHQSIDFYKQIQNNKYLQNIPSIILFNKQDLLVEKIKNGFQFENYFPDFANYTHSIIDNQHNNLNEDLQITRVKFYIKEQFLKINPNNFYHHFTCDNDVSIRLISDDCLKIYTNK